MVSVILNGKKLTLAKCPLCESKKLRVNKSGEWITCKDCERDFTLIMGELHYFDWSEFDDKSPLSATNLFPIWHPMKMEAWSVS